jgi:hypothetical protein
MVWGVSGAGPLLHRAVLAVARRHAPGILPMPASVGAVPVTICRLSGFRAGPQRPRMVEWFDPERVPADTCDWHRGSAIVLPAAFAEWEQERPETTEKTESRKTRGRGESAPTSIVFVFSVL